MSEQEVLNKDFKLVHCYEISLLNRKFSSLLDPTLNNPSNSHILILYLKRKIKQGFQTGLLPWNLTSEWEILNKDFRLVHCHEISPLNRKFEQGFQTGLLPWNFMSEQGFPTSLLSWNRTPEPKFWTAWCFHFQQEELYLARVAELDQITEVRDKQRKYHEDLRKQRLDEFMTGFAVITGKLKEMYQMITLGGDAELELVDSLDPFSEGIVFRWVESVSHYWKAWCLGE